MTSNDHDGNKRGHSLEKYKHDPGTVSRFSALQPSKPNQPESDRLLACMFHEGGCVSLVFAKRINVPGKSLGIVVLGQFVPIHFQEKCAVTA